MSEHMSACPWNGLRAAFTADECPVMTAALDELDEKFKPGVAYKCMKRTDGMTSFILVEYDQLYKAAWEIYTCALQAFEKRLPNTDLINLHAVYTASRGAAGRWLRLAKAGADNGRGEAQSIGDSLNCLFELEKAVSREARPLERIAALEANLEAANQRQLAMASAIVLAGALEKRLEASEAANAALLQRLQTLEKLLL